MTREEFAATIKSKYPQYSGIDDDVLVSRILEKYPQYEDRITAPVQDEPMTPAAPEPEKGSLPGAGSSLADVMAWRQQTMGDLGRREPQTPEETAAAGTGALIGSTVAMTAATAPMTPLGLVKGAGGMVGSYALGQYVEKKLGLPWWVGEAFALLVQKKPRSKAGKLLRDFFKREGNKEAKDALRKTIAREVAKEVHGPSPNMGTTSRTTNTPDAGLPARATLTRIPQAPKRPGVARYSGGSKAQRAWMESQGLIPGAMGPDDVLAMKARGATQEEIEAALLRAGRPDRTPWGSPTPNVGEKPANWKPGGPVRKTPAPKPEPIIQGGTAGEASATQILESVKTWRVKQRLSKPQIVSSLRQVYGIPAKEARAIIDMVL